MAANPSGAHQAGELSLASTDDLIGRRWGVPYSDPGHAAPIIFYATSRASGYSRHIGDRPLGRPLDRGNHQGVDHDAIKVGNRLHAETIIWIGKREGAVSVAESIGADRAVVIHFDDDFASAEKVFALPAVRRAQKHRPTCGSETQKAYSPDIILMMQFPSL
jgi:hypothetical protein